jgi:hypothetical protein
VCTGQRSMVGEANAGHRTALNSGWTRGAVVRVGQGVCASPVEENCCTGFVQLCALNRLPSAGSDETSRSAAGAAGSGSRRTGRTSPSRGQPQDPVKPPISRSGSGTVPVASHTLLVARRGRFDECDDSCATVPPGRGPHILQRTEHFGGTRGPHTFRALRQVRARPRLRHGLPRPAQLPVGRFPGNRRSVRCGERGVRIAGTGRGRVQFHSLLWPRKAAERRRLCRMMGPLAPGGPRLSKQVRIRRRYRRRGLCTLMRETCHEGDKTRQGRPVLRGGLLSGPWR